MQEVLDAELEQVKHVPRTGAKLNVDFILGVGTHKEKFMIIFDIDGNFHVVWMILRMEDNSAMITCE